MSCKGEKCNRAYLQHSIAEKKKTQQTKRKYFEIHRTDFRISGLPLYFIYLFICSHFQYPVLQPSQGQI